MGRKKAQAAVKIGYFDLETSNLNADLGVLLCAALAINDKPVRLFSQREFNDKFEVRHYSGDGVLCRVVAEALADCDILCAHNGQFFDLPFLRGRLAIHKLQNLRTMPLLDPCLVSRRKFRFGRHDLRSLAARLSVGGKTPVDATTWQRATLDGDEDAWLQIETHCKRDVEILRRVAGSFRGLLRGFEFNDHN